MVAVYVVDRHVLGVIVVAVTKMTPEYCRLEVRLVWGSSFFTHATLRISSVRDIQFGKNFADILDP